MIAMRTLLLGAAGIGVVALGAYAIGGDDAPAVAAPAVARPAVSPVSAPSAQPAQPAPPIDTPVAAAARPADCLIEPSQVVKVNTSVEGIVGYVAADRGQFVRRGQVVAQLRSGVESAGLAVARARAANSYAVGAAESRERYLDAKQQRSQRLSRYIARDAVEEAEANARAASMQTREAELGRRVASLEFAQSQRLLAERTVRSPIDGVVTQRAMAPGEYRGPDASHILTIAQIDPLHVEVFAPISQLRTVAIGDTAWVIPEDPVGGRYQARVKVIDRVFDAASGTFGLRLSLPNPGNKLPAGLRCRIEFAA